MLRLDRNFPFVLSKRWYFLAHDVHIDKSKAWCQQKRARSHVGFRTEWSPAFPVTQLPFVSPLFKSEYGKVRPVNLESNLKGTSPKAIPGQKHWNIITSLPSGMPKKKQNKGFPFVWEPKPQWHTYRRITNFQKQNLKLITLNSHPALL